MSESSCFKMCEMDKFYIHYMDHFDCIDLKKTNIICNGQSYGHTHTSEHKQVQQFEIENSNNGFLRILFLMNILQYVTSFDSYLIPAPKNISDITHAAAREKERSQCQKKEKEEKKGGVDESHHQPNSTQYLVSVSRRDDVGLDWFCHVLQVPHGLSQLPKQL